MRRGDLRHCRYGGVARTHLQPLLIAVALAVVRVIAWLSDIPRARTRVSRFATLMTLSE